MKLETSGGVNLSDEDPILTYLTSPSDVASLRSVGPQSAYPTSTNPLVTLVAGLLTHGSCDQLNVQKGGTSVFLAKRTG